MRPDPASPRATAADILAALSRASARRGDASLARTRLAECLTSLLSAGSARTGAVALEAAAELARAIGQPERAVEFYGARERIARRAKAADAPDAATARDHALEKLRADLGPTRFDEAWAASRATPYPLEFYVSTVLHWLEGLEWKLSSEALPGGAPAAAGPAPTAAADETTTMGSTAHLIERVREGSTDARDQLTRRYLAPLRRFAHGRLPARARDLLDTDDLVQMTMMRGLEKAGAIRSTTKGGFFAYLRRILVNQVRDEIRHRARRPRPVELDQDLPSSAPSPLDAVLEAETLDAYRAALARLPRRRRDALVLRVEYGLPYQDVADEVGCRTPNAARMLVARALESVTKQMQRRP